MPCEQRQHGDVRFNWNVSVPVDNAGFHWNISGSFVRAHRTTRNMSCIAFCVAQRGNKQGSKDQMVLLFIHTFLLFAFSFWSMFRMFSTETCFLRTEEKWGDYFGKKKYCFVFIPPTWQSGGFLQQQLEHKHIPSLYYLFWKETLWVQNIMHRSVILAVAHKPQQMKIKGHINMRTS